MCALYSEPDMFLDKFRWIRATVDMSLSRGAYDDALGYAEQAKICMERGKKVDLARSLSCIANALTTSIMHRHILTKRLTGCGDHATTRVWILQSKFRGLRSARKVTDLTQQLSSLGDKERCKKWMEMSLSLCSHAKNGDAIRAQVCQILVVY